MAAKSIHTIEQCSPQKFMLTASQFVHNTANDYSRAVQRPKKLRRMQLVNSTKVFDQNAKPQ